MSRKLSIDGVRNLEEGDYIVAKLHDDCYWQQSEGRVTSVTEYDDGGMTIHHTNGRGRGRLEVPADGRKTIKSFGAASGARNLPVTRVEKAKEY